MRRELNIRIAGEAGQGIQTVGHVLCRAFRNTGLHLFAHQDNMSRIRGGNNFFQIRISSRPVYAPVRKCDIILALDTGGALLHREALAEDGLLVADMQAGQDKRYANAAACGVLAALTGIPLEMAEKELRAVVSGKGPEITEANMKAARAGHEYGRAHDATGRFHMETAPPRRELLLTGNEAVALGAIQAGCKVYSAYPMSPSTGIMETVCRFSREYGIVVEQAEDEIAAINMVIGASFAGARAMTATSGGGFALMTEGVSLAGMTETPVVVVDAQRPGPATGFPTRTEQADLLFVINSGHGEFARVVYAPGTVEEAFAVTFQAFETAEKYQIPALILTDQLLADSIRNVDPAALTGLRPKRTVLSKEESGLIENYRRYELTPSGISPRAVPSWIPGVIYADSDEHTEKGHITEDAETRVRMVEKRLCNKVAGLTKEVRRPTVFNMENAKTVLLGFGSTYGVLKEAAVPGGDVGCVHLSQVWPFPVADILHLAGNGEMVLTVENNAGGQLARLLRQETGLNASGCILKYDGRPFTQEDIISGIGREA